MGPRLAGSLDRSANNGEAMNVIAITDSVNVAFSVGVVVACLAIGARMDRQTRCAVRFGVWGLFAGALLQAAGGIWEFGDWVQSVFLGGALIYLVANLRQPLAIPSSAWSSRLAWLVAIAVAFVVGLSLSSGEI